jgi:hypothetical protein
MLSPDVRRAAAVARADKGEGLLLIRGNRIPMQVVASQTEYRLGTLSITLEQPALGEIFPLLPSFGYVHTRAISEKYIASTTTTLLGKAPEGAWHSSCARSPVTGSTATINILPVTVGAN